jgi:hypothetical protein
MLTVVPPDYAHPLLAPLAKAQDAVARLEACAEAAPPDIAEGLGARLAYREGAGWLACSEYENQVRHNI